MIRVSIFLLIFLFLSTSFAKAGTEGGGGDVALINGKYFLLDLVEAGVEDDAYIDMSLLPERNFLDRVNFILDENFPRELIARKLTEIYQANKYMAAILIKVMENYQWRIVNGQLVNIHDENTTIDDIKLFQIAIRKSSTIVINRNLWSQLDEKNKVALVFHEIIYALDKPRLSLEPGSDIYFQRSDKARELNGFLFSDLPRQGLKGLKRFVDFSFLISADESRVFHDGDQIFLNPYLAFDIPSSTWEMSADNDFVYLKTPDDWIRADIRQACAFASHNRFPLRLVSRPGTRTLVTIDTFDSSEGKKTYSKVLFDDGVGRVLLSLNSVNDEMSCYAQMYEEIQTAKVIINKLYL